MGGRKPAGAGAPVWMGGSCACRVGTVNVLKCSRMSIFTRSENACRHVNTHTHPPTRVLNMCEGALTAGLLGRHSGPGASSNIFLQVQSEQRSKSVEGKQIATQGRGGKCARGRALFTGPRGCVSHVAAVGRATRVCVGLRAARATRHRPGSATWAAAAPPAAASRPQHRAPSR